MEPQHAIRVLTLLTTALDIPLLIALSVIQGFSTWNFAFIPLVLTAQASTVSILYRRKNGRMPGFRYNLVDMLGVVCYLGLLIPIWSIEIGRLGEPGFALLAGYATAPMIVNMFAHIYLSVSNARLVWFWLLQKKEHECPNCHSKFILAAPTVQETVQRGEGYSLLRGEDYLDNDAVQYKDVRTSEDQIGPQAEGDVEDKGKGSIKL